MQLFYLSLWLLLHWLSLVCTLLATQVLRYIFLRGQDSYKKHAGLYSILKFAGTAAAFDILNLALAC